MAEKFYSKRDAAAIPNARGATEHLNRALGSVVGDGAVGRKEYAHAVIIVPPV